MSKADEQKLAEIAAVTDTAIANFDVDDLLSALLTRVVRILRADTAAVLLVDESGQLVARAAVGIEEEVSQGVRVPLGVGFAGRVAAERRPVRLDQVSSSTVWNPILWQRGISKMLGVPLLAASRLVGVLHVGRVADAPFTDHDAQLLELVGVRIGAAVQTRQLEVERAAARVVQRSLLPSALPDCPGVEFATRFVPAGVGGVGGDWYDAFVLPSGELWVMAGDVAGHGLDAAITMSRLRAALRAYVLDGHSPGQVLALADRKLQFFDPGKMVTVLCGRLFPPFERVELATAGHLPPVYASPGQPAILLDLPGSPPIGVSDLEPAGTMFELSPGSVLFLYTDGLVERRREPLDAGLERLTDAVVAEHPEAVCRTVMGALVGRDRPEDDIVVLALRRTL